MEFISTKRGPSLRFVVLFAVLFIPLTVAMAWVTFWAVNTLFGHHIPLTLRTWGAYAVLTIMFGNTGSGSK